METCQAIGRLFEPMWHLNGFLTSDLPGHGEHMVQFSRLAWNSRQLIVLDLSGRNFLLLKNRILNNTSVGDGLNNLGRLLPIRVLPTGLLDLKCDLFR